MRKKPFSLFLSPLWILKGKANFKREITNRVIPEPTSFPYNEDVLEYARQESKTRKVVLASGTDDRIAQKVSDHFGFFDSVIASDGVVNTIGQNKLDLINEDTASGPFEYLGNSTQDLPVWKGAQGAAVVHASDDFINGVKELTTVTRVFKLKERGGFGTILRAMRVQQWVKNFLLAIPLFLSHRFLETDLVIAVIAGFFAFSFCASAVYLLNDLLDLPSDRIHPTKKNRPLAAGTLKIEKGFILVPILLIIGFTLSAIFLPAQFSLVLLAYLALTTAYSVFLKRIILVDVVVLASLYVVRLWAGSVATDVPISKWLLVFSLLFFLSLAMVKRYGELRQLKDAQLDASTRRAYRLSDMKMIGIFGPLFGFLSLVVLPFYTRSQTVVRLYSQPGLLWVLEVVLLLWLVRVWSSAYRGKMNSDPVVFTLKDPISWVLVITGILVIYFSI